jgi:hypothetical protein
MWIKKIGLFLLFTQLAFTQSQPLPLEEKIYVAIKTFAANPNVESLKKLESEEKKYHPKTNPEYLAIVLLNINKAYYQNQFGQTNNAILSYEKAWHLYQIKKLKDEDIVEECLKPLGNLYNLIGDYDNAENTIKQYFYIANIEGNQQQKLAAIINLSNVYQNNGKINEAINLLEKTVKTEKLTTAQKGILLTNLGNKYFKSSTQSASDEIIFKKTENCFLESIALLKNDKSNVEALSNAYRNISILYLEKNDIENASNFIEKAKISFSKITNVAPRKKAQFYFEQATLLFEKDNFSEASKALSIVFKTLIPNYSNSKTNLPNKNSLYAESVLLDALDLQAELFLAQNQPKKALESYQLCFPIEDLFQSLLVYENSKIISQIRNRNRTEKCIAIYYSLYQKEKKISYIESAFVLQEQSKSAVLQEYLSNSKIISREEKQILQQLQNWNTVIVKEQQKFYNANVSKINEAIKKQNELMLLLKLKRTKSTTEPKKEFDLNALYAKLEKDKAILVNYFVGNENLYAFTLENHTIKLNAIGENFKETSVFYTFINFFKTSDAISNDPKEFNRISNEVYKLVRLPKNKSNKNLIIIPDGILNFLPFEALITERNSTANFGKMHYLLNDFKIGYNNSASFYLNSNSLQLQKESVLGIFPIFENSNLEFAFSKKELQNLKRNFKGLYFEKEKATFNNFKTNAANFSILHLSTHASSGDILEPASIKFYDQEILYSELYQLNINPNLVVLSACETGLGKLYKAEGAMSVARGFQFAGAQNLLFSLWKVNDFTTSVVMKKFYKSIKKGKSYFESNHQAKLDFLNDSSIPNAKKSPYYWSAFVYYGTLEDNHSSTNYLFWIVGLIGLIALFLLLRKSFVTKFLPHKSQKKIKVAK